MTDEALPDHISVPVLWVGLDEEPVVMANQFIGQVQQDEIIISIGTLVTPAITATTPDERREQALRISHVPVQPIVRLVLTQRRLEELQTMLRDTAEIFSNRYNVKGAGHDKPDAGPV